MQIDENRIELEFDYSELYIICYITVYKRFHSLNSRFLHLFDTNVDRVTTTRTKFTHPWTQSYDTWTSIVMTKNEDDRRSTGH